MARGLREGSMRWIYPWAPGLHDAVFFQLRRQLNRVRQAIRDDQTRKLPLRLLQPSVTTDREHSPLVSIIVPCYNHARFLEERLSSIKEQSYRNWELILLDDASTDESAKILSEFKTANPKFDIRLLINDVNSGSPFKQWKRGIEQSKGSLIWIAESDDSCAHDFLETLLPFFSDESVQLSFCRTSFVDEAGAQKVWEVESYLPELGAAIWKESWIASTYQLVQKIWCRRNIIPNVSSALFRKPISLPLLDNPTWQEMRVCGDWVFYLTIARSGRVAFSPRTECNYRQHRSNTSVSSQRQNLFFEEHLEVCRQIQSMYKLTNAARQSLQHELELRWKQVHHSPPTRGALTAIGQALEPDPKRKPEIMLGAYALVAGGGELAPLRLANLLKAHGYGVSVLNAAQLTTEPKVRSRLQDGIPLFHLNSLTQLHALMDEQGVEILHTHHSWLDLTAAELLAPFQDIKLVVTSHGLYDAMGAEQLARLRTRLTPRVSEFTVVAEKNRKALEEMGADSNRITVIENALDEDKPAKIDRSCIGIHQEAFVACLVSRAIREKGWEVAINAMDIARKQTNGDLHLLLIGNGPELKRLQKKYTYSWVHFLGFQENCVGWFECSDLGLLPTEFSSESRPFTLLECLRAGRPYIASAIGDIPEMLQGKDESAGKAIPLKDGKADTAAFAEAIADYALNRELLRRHQEEAHYASKRYSSEETAAAYEKVYQACLYQDQNRLQPHFEK